MSKTDLQLKQDIELELSWDPKINAARIGVGVENGAVSLLGQVSTFAEKWAVEDAARRVAGVRTIAQEITVTLPFDEKHSDADIAGAALSALQWDVYVPDAVTARVENGNLTLSGQVGWNYERDAAEKAVRYLAGVSNVYNTITLKELDVPVSKVKEAVEAALQRQSKNDLSSITVATSGSRVTLGGTASSWQSIEDATSAAWSAPGVREVEQHIRIH